MTIAELEVGAERRDRRTRARRPPVARRRAVLIVGKRTETNCALAAAFTDLRERARVADRAALLRLRHGDLVIARLDVLPTLDGIEPGLWRPPRLEQQGVQVVNGPRALLAAHDKLATARVLGLAGVAHPRTTHVRDESIPPFPPPYVVKPRFGSWGRDVYLCRDEAELWARLERLRRRRWFRRQGALVQSLVEPTGRDLRIVVAGRRVVGAVERRAVPGEWRTNVALGAARRRVRPSAATRALAVRAVAALGLDLAGVDVAVDQNGRMYVLEVNGAVDFNETYAADVFASAAATLLETRRDRTLVRMEVSPM